MPHQHKITHEELQNSNVTAGPKVKQTKKTRPLRHIS